MLTLNSPYTKQEISAALAAEGQAIHAYFSALPADTFFTAPPAVWSPADNLVHLIVSVNQVSYALGLPKAMLKLRFGKAKSASRDIHTIIDLYQAQLAQGAEASGQYLPQVETTTAAERDRILAKWTKKADGLVAALASWSNEDLERVRLPHPILGKMTVREILLFTLYHNMHHVNDVHTLHNTAQENWFAK